MRLLTNQWYVFLAHFTEKFYKVDSARQCGNINASIKTLNRPLYKDLPHIIKQTITLYKV